MSAIRNWKTFDDRSLDFCQGITLHHLLGHTDGLIGMQINMIGSGTFFFVSDHCHVMENVSADWRSLLNVELMIAVVGWHPPWLASSRSPGMV